MHIYIHIPSYVDRALPLFKAALLVAFGLQVEEPGVGAFQAQQLLMAAELFDDAVVQHRDLVLSCSWNPGTNSDFCNLR